MSGKKLAPGWMHHPTKVWGLSEIIRSLVAEKMDGDIKASLRFRQWRRRKRVEFKEPQLPGVFRRKVVYLDSIAVLTDEVDSYQLPSSEGEQ